MVLRAEGPPSSMWMPPEESVNQVFGWLQWLLYFAVAASILATIVLGALLILDKNRGEPVSATSPHVRFLRIALGTMIASSAGSIAIVFF